MLITGRRTSKIKTYNDPYIRCRYCDAQSIRFTVYREYFHCFFIPVFPSDIKEISGVCMSCGVGNANPIKEEYLEKTRTPLYFWTAWILALLLISTGAILSNLKK